VEEIFDENELAFAPDATDLRLDITKQKTPNIVNPSSRQLSFSRKSYSDDTPERKNGK
jgi:hypothetical protein